LRLLFGTSRRWLDDGKQLAVERAPTAFGPVSVLAESRLSAGQIILKADLPSRNQPKHTLLRARVPDGWRINKATIDGQELSVDGSGTVDLSGRTGEVTIKFSASRK